MSFLGFGTKTPSRSEVIATNVSQGVAVAVLATLFIRGIDALLSAAVGNDGEDGVGVPTNKELRSACREAGIRGYSKMNKQQLVNALGSAAGA